MYISDVRKDKKMFKQFTKKINCASKKSMAEFLSGHTRYDLMNSWNASTSYANSIKIYNLHITDGQAEQLYNMLSLDEPYAMARHILTEFCDRYDGRYQIGANGRSSGYLVLYNGVKKQSDYKSICTSCGQMNFTMASKNDCRCGRCGKNSRINLEQPRYTYSVNFQSIDADMWLEDFMDQSMDELKEKAKLVQDFDRTCDEYINALLDIADTYDVAEKTQYIPVKTKILTKRKKKGTT